MYNMQSAIRQGARKGTDFVVLKEWLSLNWTSPYNILAVGGPTAAAVTFRTDDLCMESCSTLDLWTYLRMEPALTRNVASLWCAASLAEAHKTAPICENICSAILLMYALNAQHTLRNLPRTASSLTTSPLHSDCAPRGGTEFWATH